MRKMTVVAALLLLGSAAGAEEYYRWTDARGVLHYTNHHPPAEAERLVLPALPNPPPQPRSYVEEWDWEQTTHPKVGVHILTEEHGRYSAREQPAGP